MRGLLALGLMLMLLLAGCAAKGNGTTSSSATRSATTTHATTSAASTATLPPASANRTNHPPTAGLVAKAGNGTAALNVTFALTGSDVDGDALNWTLTFGDGNRTTGAALPANATHHFGSPGLHNVTLAVSDGRATTFANATVNLTASAPKVVQSATGKWSASSQDCPGASSTTAPATVYFPGPLKGINYDVATVAPATIGQPFAATFTPDGDTGGVLFADSAGKVLLRVNPAAGTLTGTVPAGAASVYFFSCLSDPDAMSVAYVAY